MRQLNDSELTTIANCARVAMEKFQANAKELRAADAGADDGLKQTYARLAEQFDRQAKDAKAVAEIFDNMPPNLIATCEACARADPEHSRIVCADRRLLALINQ